MDMVCVLAKEILTTSVHAMLDTQVWTAKLRVVGSAMATEGSLLMVAWLVLPTRPFTAIQSVAVGILLLIVVGRIPRKIAVT